MNKYILYLILLSHNIILSIIYKEAKLKHIPYYQVLFFNNIIFYLTTLISYKVFFSKKIKTSKPIENNKVQETSFIYNQTETSTDSQTENLIDSQTETSTDNYIIKNFEWNNMTGYTSKIKQFFYIGKLFKTLTFLNCLTLYIGVFTYVLDISIVYSLYTIQYLIILLYNIVTSNIIKSYWSYYCINSDYVKNRSLTHTNVDDDNTVDMSNKPDIINIKIEIISLIKNIIVFCMLLISFIFGVRSFIDNNYNISQNIFIVLYVNLIILSAIRDILKYKNNKLIKNFDNENKLITYNIKQIDILEQNKKDQFEFPILYYIDEQFMLKKIFGKKIEIPDDIICNINIKFIEKIWNNNFTVRCKRLLLLLIINGISEECDVYKKADTLKTILNKDDFDNDFDKNEQLSNFYNDNYIYSLFKYERTKCKYILSNELIKNFEFTDKKIDESNKLFDIVEKIKFNTIDNRFKINDNIYDITKYFIMICEYHNWYYDNKIKFAKKNIDNLNNHNNHRLIIFLYKLSKYNIYVSLCIFFITFFGIDTYKNLNNFNFNPYMILYTILGSLVLYLGIISNIVISTKISSNTYTILTIIRRIPLLFIATFMYNENIDNNLWISIYIQIGASIFDIIFKWIINIFF